MHDLIEQADSEIVTINGDDRNDVAVGLFTIDVSLGFPVQILGPIEIYHFNAVSSQFSLSESHLSGEHLLSLVATDLNGDGRTDLASLHVNTAAGSSDSSLRTLLQE